MQATRWRQAAAGVLLFATAVLSTGVPAAAQLFGRKNELPDPERRRVNPTHERIKTEAKSAYERREYDKVVELCTAVLNENPTDHLALYFRGSARIELGQARGDANNVRSGIADARQAVSLGANENHVYYLPYLYGMTQLSLLEQNAAHSKVSVDVATQLLGSVPLKDDDKAQIHYQRGVAHAARRATDEAAADFRATIRFNPQHMGARVALANAYVAAERFDDARKAFDELVAAAPNDPLSWNNRGQFLQARGMADEAVIDFTRAIERNPQFLVAYVNRGFTLLERDDPESAEADFTAAIKLDPRYAVPYGLRGAARFAQGKINEAIADHVQAQQLMPKNPVAWADLAFARFFAKDFAGAARDFGQAMALDANLRYLQPWRFWAQEVQGAGQTARAERADSLKKPDADKDWTDNLLAFVAGSLDEAALLDRRDKTDMAVRTAQTCEAEFFLGLKAEQAGDAAGAAKHFRASVDTRERHLSAYRGARFALRAGTAKTGP